MGDLGGEFPPRGPAAEPFSGGFSAARCRSIKCNFTAAPQAGKERFLYLFQINPFSFKKLDFFSTLSITLDCHSEFSKSDSRFVISDPYNPHIPIST